MIINKKLYFWFGLALVILVSVFTWSVVHDFRQNDKQIIQDLKYQNTISEAREIIAKAQRDSARIEQMRMAFKLDEMERKLDEQYNQMNAFRINYDNHVNELNNIPDEKDYIPNATTEQQLNFLSNYKYKELP